MARNFTDEEETDRQKRNIFRCALSHISAIIVAADGTMGAFIHKAFTGNSNPPLYIS
jgi:hypothetical protein